jgi:hypothetical protein
MANTANFSGFRLSSIRLCQVSSFYQYLPSVLSVYAFQIDEIRWNDLHLQQRKDLCALDCFLQVVVKLSSIPRTPEKLESDGGTWNIKEHIFRECNKWFAFRQQSSSILQDNHILMHVPTQTSAHLRQ